MLAFFLLNQMGYMTEAVKLKIFFSPFYGAFLAVTLLCLSCATPKKRTRGSRIILWILGFVFLLLQGICWGAATA